MKIAVYGLAINDQAFINDFLACLSDADLVLVADCGAADGSADGLAAAGVTVRRVGVRPWRFDDARNTALALLPDDIDLCVSLDVGERLLPGWRAAVEDAWRPGASLMRHPMVAGRLDDGGPWLQRGERIHARHGLRWKAPCHEYLAVDRRADGPVAVSRPLIEIVAPGRLSPADELALLALGAGEDPLDAHVAHAYGRALRRAGRLPEALAELERCLTLPTADADEHNATLRLIGMCRFAGGDRVAGRRWLRRAVRERPELRGAWTDLACAYYLQSHWQACLAACDRAAAAPEPGDAYGAQSQSGALPEDMASVSAWRLGRRQLAIDWGHRAVAAAPRTPRLRANLQMMLASPAA
jgi:tetratricopeptide (TPR) repeat protein